MGGGEGRGKPPAASTGEYDFLIGRLVDRQTLQRAQAAAAVSGRSPVVELIARGIFSQQDYIRELAAEISRRGPHPVADASRLIEAMSETPALIEEAAVAAALDGKAPLVATPQALEYLETDAVRRARAEAATSHLERERPDLSAHRPHATWQLVFVPAALGLACGALAVFPQASMPVLAALATLPFVAVVLLRLVALALVLTRTARSGHMRQRLRRVPDTELPVYTILVPLFKEAEVLPDIVDAISRLDYPFDKLDVLLVLEADDASTLAAVRTVALPPYMRVIVVPTVGPQTKPKALNYAMQFARGAFVVVFDAEDEPEPGQLRRALAAFRYGPPGLACVQAPLSIYNAEESLISRQFALDYAALFDGLLPAIVLLRMPVPLGGTSNHFPRAVLQNLLLWDAYNVTEDADLGMRIARSGGRVAMLASTTNEEAPPQFGIWLRQRTRWLKGFMQTWLVHMRRPHRLLSELGVWGFIGFHIYLGGIVLSALLHPLFLAVVAMQVASGSFPSQPISLGEWLLTSFALFNLVAGYASGMALAAAAAARRGFYRLLPHVLLMPFYWLLISLAAWRAVVQLWRDPYLWEKTPHGSRSRRRRSNHHPR